MKPICIGVLVYRGLDLECSECLRFNEEWISKFKGLELCVTSPRHISISWRIVTLHSIGAHKTGLAQQNFALSAQHCRSWCVCCGSGTALNDHSRNGLSTVPPTLPQLLLLSLLLLLLLLLDVRRINQSRTTMCCHAVQHWTHCAFCVTGALCPNHYSRRSPLRAIRPSVQMQRHCAYSQVWCGLWHAGQVDAPRPCSWSSVLAVGSG